MKDFELPTEKSSQEETQSFIALLREELIKDISADEHNRTPAEEDLRFRVGDQWPQDIKNLRGNAPCLSIPKINSFVEIGRAHV